MTHDEVRLEGITKAFGAVVANDGVDLRLRRGEIHAVLGENGAGKTTLMNILSGLYQPDSGEMTVWGEHVRFRSPRDALRRGIGMVHQEFQLVDVFTVTDNILLGAAGGGFRLRRARVREAIRRLAAEHGLSISPEAYVWQLAVGEQQRVEILKLLYRGADLLMLDEPTSVLTPGEADDLYATLRRLADAGKAIVFITHKLNEVMAAADRITVLRRGRVVRTVATADTSIGDLAQLMVGAAPSGLVAARPEHTGEVVLRTSGLSALNHRGVSGLRDVSLTVHRGEILGVVGVAGNGQSDLSEAIAGLRRPSAGTIEIGGRDMTGADALGMMRAGVRYVPVDRTRVGLVPPLDLVANVMLRDFRAPPFARGPWLDLGAARERTRTVVDRFQVRAAGLAAAVRDLSGGNQQKLVLGRELLGQPRLLVAEQPTRGLDIDATAAVHDRLVEMRNAGVAVLLVSEDLDEALRLSDRIAVMYGGAVVALVPRFLADRNTIGALMGGHVAPVAGA